MSTQFELEQEFRVNVLECIKHLNEDLKSLNEEVSLLKKRVKLLELEKQLDQLKQREKEETEGLIPPANCMERLRYEGKPYPRGACAICGQLAPKSNECFALIKQNGGLLK